jgi:hypothetical protein
MYPIAGETVTFTLDQLANYADNVYALTPVAKDLTIEITKDGSLIKTDILHVIANTDTSKTLYTYTWTPLTTGNYGIRIVGNANDVLCKSLLTNIPDETSLNIRVSNNPNAGSYLKFPTGITNDANDHVDEGQTLSVAAGAQYNGNLPLSYAIVGNNHGAVINQNGQLSWNVDYNTVSHEESIVNYLLSALGVPLSDRVKLTLSVTEQGGILNDVKEIEIKVKDVNRAPVIRAPAEISITANGQFDIKSNIQIADPDVYDKLDVTYGYPLDNKGVIQDTSLLSGEYPITISVSDNFGGSAVAVLVLKIANPFAPVAVITVSQSQEDAAVFNFDGQSSYSPIKKRIVAYEWNFGDGSKTSNQRSVTTKYPGDKGIYFVTLKVTDEDGRVGSSIVQIQFSQGTTPVKDHVELHKFAIQNIVVEETKKDLNVFVNLRNLGNEEENVMLATSIENTNIRSTMQTVLDTNEGSWQLMKLPKTSINGQYVIRVAANSDDYDTLTYRVIKA